MAASYEHPPEDTRLDQWMTAASCTIHKLAKELRFSERTIKLWRSGRVVPPLAAAFAIDAYTEGQVPASSWLTLEIAKRRKGGEASKRNIRKAHAAMAAKRAAKRDAERVG